MQRRLFAICASIASAVLTGCSTLPLPDRNAAPEVVNETETPGLGDWNVVAPIDPGLPRCDAPWETLP